MKKITVLLFFISLNAFSQIHILTHKSEKISYKEYDYLKYISSLDENLLYTENVLRYYDNGTNLLYSIIETTKDNTTSKIYLYPTGTLEYTTSAKVKDKTVLRQGTLKTNGSNNFLTVSSCDPENCFYILFVNKDIVYKNTVPTVK